MARALREARKGRPSPNPHVGALVAHGDDIVAVGHHMRRGGPHAEIVALARAGARARGATLYATLEPCNHQGLTGPCTEAIIAAAPARVVIGCEDPTGHARGGIDRLRAAGIEVAFSTLRNQAEAVVADFSKHARTGLPLVTLKAAVTLDGHMATRTGDSRWITGEPARTHAHRLRAGSDAILVGSGTLLADDPALTVRHVRGPNPLRVVLDGRLRTPLSAQLVRTARETPSLIFHGTTASARKAVGLARAGVDLVALPLDRHGRLPVRKVLRELGRRGVLSVLVEGGPTVHGALLDARCADRAEVFVAPVILGDAGARVMVAGKPRRRMADASELLDVETRRFGRDTLIRGRLR